VSLEKTVPLEHPAHKGKPRRVFAHDSFHLAQLSRLSEASMAQVVPATTGLGAELGVIHVIALQA
jgi:hypothetical protein